MSGQGPEDRHWYRGPKVTVDILIQMPGGGVVLIKRRNPPFGWALPGGFVDQGESLEQAAVREAREETSLEVVLLRQLHTYSDPRRDPRQHTVSTVFVAVPAGGELAAADDAAEAGVFTTGALPEQMAFDHREILDDYFSGRYTEGRKPPLDSLE